MCKYVYVKVILKKLKRIDGTLRLQVGKIRGYKKTHYLDGLNTIHSLLRH